MLIKKKKREREKRSTIDKKLLNIRILFKFNDLYDYIHLRKNFYVILW